MKITGLLIMGILLIGFSGTAQETEKLEKNSNLDELVASKRFRIESLWARAQGGNAVNAIANANLQPLGSSGNRFNLATTPNYFEMQGDSVMAYLPYFGEIQFGGDHYSNDGSAIEFKGIPSDLNIEKNEEKDSYEIAFHIDTGTETFQVNMKLYPSLKSLMTINSNRRFVIRYDGKVEALEIEERSK